MKAYATAAAIIWLLGASDIVDADAYINSLKDKCHFPKDQTLPDEKFRDSCTISLDDRGPDGITTALGVSITTEQFGDALNPYTRYGYDGCKVVDDERRTTILPYWWVESNVDCVAGNCTVTRRLACWKLH